MFLGCKLSTPEKDSKIPTFSISSKLESIVSDLQTYIIPEFTPISDQQTTNSCVANSVCDNFEILKGLENRNKVVQLSRMFVYWNARHYTNSENIDDGSFITDAMQSLIDFGVCREDTWRFDINHVNKQPGILSFKEADDNKINTFNKIRSSENDKLQEIETCIKANHPISFGCAVSDEFLHYFSGDPEKVFEYPEKSVGNHAMIIVGVGTDNRNNLKKYLLRNSWTTNWGSSDCPGHAWVSAEYVKKFEDVYVATLAPDLLI